MGQTRLQLAALLVTTSLCLASCPERPPSAPLEGGVSTGDGGKDALILCIPRCEGKPCGGDDGCGGRCTVGFCALGQRCDEGTCRCDQSSCPEGCCQQNACFVGAADSHCGTAGQACVDCLAAGQSCGADQSCFACQPQCAGKACGAPNECGGICSIGSCPEGQLCSGGQCVCNALSCATGCCENNFCYPGDDDSRCGTQGGLCADCDAAEQQCQQDRVCRTCQPQCAGKACGAPDSCGGFCQTGSCAAGQRCAAGQCICDGTSCPGGCCDGNGCVAGDGDTLCGRGIGDCLDCTQQNAQCVDQACKDCSGWRVGPIAANLKDAVVDSDGRIYAVGSTTNSMQLVKVDSCGTLEAQKTWGLTAQVTKRGGNTIALVNNDLWVAGTATLTTDPNNGFYARFNKTNLTAQMDKGIWGSGGADEIWSMVWTGSAFFMNGTSNYDVSAKAWSVKANATGDACGTTVFTSGGGNGRRARLDPSGSYVYYSGGHDGAAYVARYPVSGCTITPCNPCQAPWSMTFQVDGNTTEARDVLVVGSSLYVAGFYVLSSSDSGGFVAKIDVATQAVDQIFRWTPTSSFEILQTLAYDGTRLYVGGGRAIATDGSGGNAALLALSPALAKQWELAPGEPRLYWDVELAGSDGLIVTGGSETQGWVRRCLRSGSCP